MSQITIWDSLKGWLITYPIGHWFCSASGLKATG